MIEDIHAPGIQPERGPGYQVRQPCAARGVNGSPGAPLKPACESLPMRTPLLTNHCKPPETMEFLCLFDPH